MSATLLKRDFNTVVFCEICKFSKSTFFIVSKNSFSGYFGGLARVFKRVQNKNRCDCQQYRPYSAGKMYLLPQNFRSRCRRYSEKKRSVALLLERGFIITAKILRTHILKKICERLLVKISISVTNSESVAQRSSMKKVFLEILQNSQ